MSVTGRRLGKLRVTMWNVRSITGRTRELARALRRKVNIAYVLETKWIGDKAKEMGNGYNILYTGKTNKEMKLE